jgi:hypothetical protein
MSLDLNDAGAQLERGAVIPAGSHVKLRMHIRPGGSSAPGLDALDAGLLTQSKKSDVLMLDCEFTVVGGPHNNRKLWQNMTVSGGSLDEKGVSKGWNVTKATLRAVIESATATKPDDMSEEAKAKRRFQAFRQLDGIEFYARVGVEAGDDRPGGGKYPDKNRIDHVVTPADPEYAAMRAGQEVAPAATAAVAPKGGAQSAAAKPPAWAQPGGAAPATAAATAAAPPAAAKPAATKPAWLT